MNEPAPFQRCPETSSTPFHHYYASYNIISPATNSFYILGEGEDMFEDPPRMHRGDGGSHYPRVIVRLADRLLRIRADLTDAVDSAYSDLCSRP